MRVKKFLACLLAGTMVLSMVACGGTANVSTTADEVAASTEEAPVQEEVAEVAAPGEASIDFEDGKMDFVAVYVVPANADNSEVTVVDYNGSKALQVKNVDGNVPYVAIDISSVLGADVAKVASVEMTIGVSYTNGKFSACSGKIVAWSGEKLVETTDDWSVYLETKNPKVATATIAAGEEFVADCNNIIMVTLNTDNGIAEANGNATMYLDDIRFLDASGNLLTGDTSVAFAAPKGFVKEGKDMNLCYLANPYEVEGYAVSAGAWAQAGVDVTDAIKEALVPGSMIEVNYKADAPVWLVAVSDGNPNGDWIRVGINDDFVSQGYVASDCATVQYSYEQLEAALGADFLDTLQVLQCESSADWEVFSMNIGAKSSFAALGNATPIDGFAVSSGAWAQAGVDVTDDMKALLVPGAVIEVDYSADSPVWLVAVSDGNPNGDWIRVGIDEEFNTLGGVADGKVQYTYEQLEAALGADFLDTLQVLQCEASVDWEVYGVSVGKAIKPAKGVTILDGSAVSAGAWAQAGVDATDDVKALLVPGSVINVNYSADVPVWLVGVSDGNPNGDWIRCAVNEDTFISQGACTDSFAQFTYEQLEEKLGKDFVKTLAVLQCESSADWEVYNIAIGMAE